MVKSKLKCGKDLIPYPFPDIEREAREWVKKDYAKFKMARKRIKGHYRKVPVTRDPEEHFRRPLYSRVRVKSYLRKVI